MKNIWIVILAALVVCSPLFEGGDNYYVSLGVRLAVAGCALGYLLGQAAKGGVRLVFPAGNRLLIALLIIFSASLPLSSYKFVTIYWYSNALAYFLLFYLSLSMLSGEQGGKACSALILFFTASGLIQAGTGWHQYFFQAHSRVAGTFFNPSYYAGYLAGTVSFPLAGAAFELWPKASGRKKAAARIGFAFCAIVMMAAAFLSGSRSALFVVIPVMVVLAWRFRYKALGFLAVLILAAALVPNPLRQRLLTMNEDRYAWERITIWKAAARMIFHHPQGVGLGMFEYYFPRYAPAMGQSQIGRYGVSADQAHNEILTFAAEASLPAPIVGIAFLIIIGRRILRGIRAGLISRENSARVIAFSGSALAVLGHSLVDYNLHQPPTLLLFVLGLAALLAVSGGDLPGLLREERFLVLRRGLLSYPAAAAALLYCGFVAYQTAFPALYSAALKIPDGRKMVPALYKISRWPSGYAPVYFQLGENFRRAFIAQNDPALGRQAALYYEFAAGLNPQSHQYHYEWAESLFRIAASQRSIKVFEESETQALRAAELAPGQVFTYTLLSGIALAKKEPARAEQWLRVALGYEPYFLRARIMLAGMLAREGKKEEAQKELELLKSRQAEIDLLLKNNPSFLNSYQRLVVSYDPEALAGLEQQLR